LLELSPWDIEFELTALLDGDVFDVGPTAGGLELLLLLDDWLEEGEGKRKGVLSILPLSDIDAAIVIIFEVVGLMLLSYQCDVHDKPRTILLSLLSVSVA
jgi:hypothetical protein